MQSDPVSRSTQAREGDGVNRSERGLRERDAESSEDLLWLFASRVARASGKPVVWGKG